MSFLCLEMVTCYKIKGRDIFDPDGLLMDAGSNEIAGEGVHLQRDVFRQKINSRA